MPILRDSNAIAMIERALKLHPYPLGPAQPEFATISDQPGVDLHPTCLRIPLMRAARSPRCCLPAANFLGIGWP
jgi:hypothetical protein